MLCILCALPCEAQSVISLFQLKKEKQTTLFPVYSNEEIFLVISGIGKWNAAAATTYVHHFSGLEKPKFFLNIGIAGHSHCDMGQSIFAVKVLENNAQQCFYPVDTLTLPLLKSVLITNDRPEKNFTVEAAYDMEAFGIFSVAKKWTTLECIHSYKIISDNPKQSFSDLNSEKVFHIFENKKEELHFIISKMLTLVRALSERHSNADLSYFFDRWHFTQTQNYQLKRLMQKWKTCSKNDDIIIAENTCKNAKEVLYYLEKKINSTELNY